MTEERKDLLAGLAKSKGRICKHMNEDHEDSLLAYARFWHDRESTSARMIDVVPTGFILRIETPDSVREGIEIKFTSELKNAGQVRKIAVAMHVEAFNGLGFLYKVRQGFYSRYAAMALKHMPRSVLFGAAVASIGIGLAARRYLS